MANDQLQPGKTIEDAAHHDPQDVKTRFDGKAENGEVGSRRSQSRAQLPAGKFITPHDAIFLHNGDILVAEWLPIGRLTLLRRT